MKNKKITILLIVINIILIGIICSLISKNGNIIKDKQTIKEMTETEYDNSITALNKSHTDYADYIQTCKTKLATAITDMGVETSENADVDTMASNIRSICNINPDNVLMSSTSNTILVENGKKYLVCAANVRGYDISISLTGCDVIYNFGQVESGANSYRCAVLKTFMVKATSDTITISPYQPYHREDIAIADKCCYICFEI